MVDSELLLRWFRGRENVVAVANDRGGLSPQLLERPLIPSDLEETHLNSSGTCLGYYLLRTDDHVHVSCVDLDGKNGRDSDWREKAVAVYTLLDQADLNPVCEISASGQGCHVYLFFPEAVPAWLPRVFFQRVAEKLETTFAEIFPRQDSLRNPDSRVGRWGSLAYVSC